MKLTSERIHALRSIMCLPNVVTKDAFTHGKALYYGQKAILHTWEQQQQKQQQTQEQEQEQQQKQQQ